MTKKMTPGGSVNSFVKISLSRHDKSPCHATKKMTLSQVSFFLSLFNCQFFVIRSQVYAHFVKLPSCERSIEQLKFCHLDKWIAVSEMH